MTLMTTLARAVDELRRVRRASRVARVFFFVWLVGLLLLAGRYDALAPFFLPLVAPAWLLSKYLSFRAKTQMCPRCHLQLSETGRWGRLIIVPRCPACGLAIEGRDS